MIPQTLLGLMVISQFGFVPLVIVYDILKISLILFFKLFLRFTSAFGFPGCPNTVSCILCPMRHILTSFESDHCLILGHCTPYKARVLHVVPVGR